MCEVKARDRGWRVHGQGFGEGDACVFFSVQHLPHRRLLCVVRLRWVAWCRSNTLKSSNNNTIAYNSNGRERWEGGGREGEETHLIADLVQLAGI